jgi:TonB family protein
MPSIATPPNPAPAAPPPAGPPAPEPVKVATRFGELDHTELVQLLDSLEGDNAKSRFRESVYISIIFYLALAWLLVYGPKYVFHTGRIVPSIKEQKERERLTELALNDLAKTPKAPPLKAAPKLDQKDLKQLQAMQRASEAEKAALQPAPKPPTETQAAPPPTPAPLPTVATSQPAPPLPAAPTPQARPAPAAIPDAPQPSFATQPATAGSSVEQAARAALGPRGGGRLGAGGGSRIGQQMAGDSAEILSDTRGVDFTDWIKRMKRAVTASWYPLIPEEVNPPLNKEGWTRIRIKMDPSGNVTEMHLEDSTHDRAIDKAAWGSITGLGGFPPLPKEYTGKDLELRMQFVISHNPADVE